MSLAIFGFVLTFASICGVLSARATSYICLDENSQLPPCNFEWIQEKTAENIPLINNRDNDIDGTPLNQGGMIILKLMGCIPLRLSLSLPKCKSGDYSQAQRVVEIPFKFPVIDQWWRYIRNSRGELSTDMQIHNFHADKVIDDTLIKLIKERSNILYPLVRDSINRKYHEHWNKLDADESSNKNRRRSRSDITNSGIEFPYSEAIPFDSKKHWMLLHHRPEDIQYDPAMTIIPEELDEQHEIADTTGILRRRDLMEFPYAKAIPFDSKKHGMLLNHLNDHREVPLNSLNLKNYLNSDMSNLINMAMLNNLNQFRKNKQSDCDMLTIKKREAAEDERKIVLDDWKTSEIRQRLSGQLRHKIPTRTKKIVEN